MLAVVLALKITAAVAFMHTNFMKNCPLSVTFLCKQKPLVVFVYMIETVSSHLLGIHSYKPQSFFKIVKKGMDRAA